MKAYIAPEAKRKLELYTEFASGEVSGLGIATVVNKKIYVQDVFLLKQESGGSETELDQEAIAQLMIDMMEVGADLGSLKVWWHSHANMGVFWSGTDEATAGKFGNGWMLSIVVNKRNESLCRLDVYEPVPLVVDKIDLEVGLPMDDIELRAAIKAEVEEKVKSRVTVVTGFHQGQGYNGNGNWRGQNQGGGAIADDNWKNDPGWEQDSKGVWQRKIVSAGSVEQATRKEALALLNKAETDEEYDEAMKMYGCGF